MVRNGKIKPSKVGKTRAINVISARMGVYGGCYGYSRLARWGKRKDAYTFADVNDAINVAAALFGRRWPLLCQIIKVTVRHVALDNGPKHHTRWHDNSDELLDVAAV